MLATSTIDQILSSATLGGTVTFLCLALLGIAQVLYWRRPSTSPAVRLSVVGLAAVSCVAVIFLIAARFLIIA